MIYLIYGHQLPVIKKTLKNLINKCLNGEEANDFNVEKFSSRNVTVQEIVFSLSSLPLMSSRKIVVVSEPYYLDKNAEKASIDKEQDFDTLKNYLNNPNEFSDLIFFLESSSLDKKNEIYKLIEAKGEIIVPDILSEDMLNQMGKSLFNKKKVSISQEALDELSHRCGDDVSKFTNEATKLALYKDVINVEDVRLMVPYRLEDNVFDLSEALLQSDIERALKVYYDLKIMKQEPIVLVSILASQFKFMNSLQYLLNQGYSIDQAAKELNCKPYRVKVTLSPLKNLSKARLRRIIDELYKLDYDIKAGNKDPYLGFELFLINFKNI